MSNTWTSIVRSLSQDVSNFDLFVMSEDEHNRLMDLNDARFLLHNLKETSDYGRGAEFLVKFLKEYQIDFNVVISVNNALNALDIDYYG